MYGVAIDDNSGFVDDFQFQNHISNYLIGGGGDASIRLYNAKISRFLNCVLPVTMKMKDFFFFFKEGKVIMVHEI